MKTALLTVEPSNGHGYPMCLTHEGHGESVELATATIPNPLPAAPAATMPLADVLRCNDTTADLSALGTYLGEMVLGEEIAAALARLADDEPKEPVRLLLRVRPPELERLPWELMRSSAGPLPLFASSVNPCARLCPHAPLAAAEETEEQRDCWPLLRVLVIVGSDPIDEPRVQADAEIEKIRAALVQHSGFVDLEILLRPDRELLAARYAEGRPHVCHFIGHTEIAGDGGIALAFAPCGDRPGRLWTATEIAMDLEGWTPRLVVLNTCRSAQQQTSAGPWELRDAFRQLGVPAIVAMHGEIDGAAAATFGGALYESLVDEHPIDAAVAQARKGLYGDPLWSAREAWLPCLTLYAAPERLLPRRFSVDWQQRRNLRRAFKRIHAFVDRSPERRALWRHLADEGDDAETAGVLAIVGDREIGKSALARWCLGALALRGRNVGYVNLKGLRQLDTLGLLGTIAETLASTEPHAAANKAAFDAYLAEIDRAQGRTTPPDPVEEGYYQRRLEAGPEDAARQACGVFTAALARAAGDTPLVIALDPVSAVHKAHWENYVRPLLLQPVAEGHMRHARFVLVSDRPAFEELVVPPLSHLVELIELDRLPGEHYTDYVIQYCAARGFDVMQTKPIIEHLALQNRGASWSGAHFTALDQVGAALSWQESDPW